MSNKEIIDIGFRGKDTCLPSFISEFFLYVRNTNTVVGFLLQSFEQWWSRHLPAFLSLFAGRLLIQRNESDEIITIHEFKPVFLQRGIMTAMVAYLIKNSVAKQIMGAGRGVSRL